MFYTKISISWERTKTFDEAKSKITIALSKEELEKSEKEERLKEIEHNKINYPNDYQVYLKEKDGWGCSIMLRSMFDPNITRAQIDKSISQIVMPTKYKYKNVY